MSENVPNDLLYTETTSGPARKAAWSPLCITQFAVDQLGDVTQVDLPNEGEVLKAHEVSGP